LGASTIFMGFDSFRCWIAVLEAVSCSLQFGKSCHGWMLEKVGMGRVGHDFGLRMDSYGGQ